MNLKEWAKELKADIPAVFLHEMGEEAYEKSPALAAGFGKRVCCRIEISQRQ